MSHRFHLPREGLILLAAIAVGWGFNWPVMKVVLSEVPPLTFRGLCLVVGGFGVLALARLSGQSWQLPREAWGRMAWLSFFNIVGWNILATYGLQYLPSGRAALLGYTMPLWCVPLSVWLLGEPLGLRRVIAVLLGMGGVVVLMGNSLGGLLGAPLGVLLMVGAAWCWAAGMVLMKRWPMAVDTVVLTGWMMLFGGVPMCVAALLVDGVPVGLPSLWPLLGLLYNVVVGFMFCYWAWNRLVLLVPVAVSSLASLITPLVGVLAGAWLLGERIGWQEAAAAGLILSAVGVLVFSGQGKSATKAGAD